MLNAITTTSAASAYQTAAVSRSDTAAAEPAVSALATLAAPRPALV